MATQISPHFTLEEMLTSQTAIRFRYNEQFIPPNNVKQSLTALCQNVLEPIRIAVAKPIRVSSGYRCLRVNSKIGGSKTSQHMDGEAADIQVLSITVEELFQFIKSGNFPYDQLIQEFDSWVHVSFGPRNRRQPLRAIKLGNGQTKYLPG
ncbi:D-Ala-D-Ala carboxypeptidase family metallohydrolase [Dyadobacter frigoris]|uniref:Peptidase M15A n=1 Tax=Dyadobacter frigoris TaxID=2576211 RepID=A0A4V6BJF6_9BACT|nr:D-Ala-D-Ala carboxypeptidase family metallohydrolase [Dyadobacter frigoris]TKT91913.1 peptidase M15A [Dyadobacter frigoris]GLU53217.1 peptidase M15 [Dyadobacter frigoris]